MTEFKLQLHDKCPNCNQSRSERDKLLRVLEAAQEYIPTVRHHDWTAFCNLKDAIRATEGE